MNELNTDTNAYGDTAAINNSTSANATLSPPTTTGNQQQQSANTGQVADLSQFINYIKQFVPVLLDTSSVSNIEFERVLNEKSNGDYLKKFLADPQTKNLIFTKFYAKGNFLNK